MNSRTPIVQCQSASFPSAVSFLMRTYFLGVLVFLISILLPLRSSQAQQTTGNLQGQLIDFNGLAVTNANIVVTGPGVPGMFGTVSSSDGTFHIRMIPPGIVTVSVTHVQYQHLDIEKVFVSLGKQTSLGVIMLRSRSHDLPEVIVSGAKPLIDPTATASITNLRSSDFQNLPIDRSYRSITALVPQANISYYGDEVNVSGATGSENRYFVDGMEVTDPTFGMTGTNLPYNFIKEIQVVTGGYEAEYRSSLGGLVNVITHSGSNEFHGSLFGFYTGNGFAAPKRPGLLDPTQGGFSNHDLGLDISGPIIRDELWFYGAYNPIFNRRDVEMPGFGVSADKTITHAFAGKLTWRSSGRSAIALVVTGDPFTRRAIGEAPPLTPSPAGLGNPDPYLTDQRGGGTNIALSGWYAPNDRTLLEGTISRIARDHIWKASTERGQNEVVLINAETGTWSGGSFGEYSIFSSGTTARIVGTILSGSHSLKSGVEYRDNRVHANVDFPNSLTRVNDTLYIAVLNATRGTVHNRIPTIFFQDTWEISRYLRIHAGVRWDGQFIFGGDGILAQRITTPIQPRFGIVFVPDDNGIQKIFGSIGRYTQEWHTAVMTGVYTGTGYFYEIHYTSDPRVAGGSPGDTVISTPARIQPEEPGLSAQYYDEYTLGYERIMSENLKMRIQVNHRSLQEAITAGLVQGGFQLGNPGKGILSGFPRARRDYTALMLTLEGRVWGNFDFISSYVLSRNYGNYEGLYDSHTRNIVPNVNFAYLNPNLENALGLLPNDRTHVFKFSGSYGLSFGFITGFSFLWQSGTPLSNIAGFGTFLQQRGTAGRTPDIWDLSARFSYVVPFAIRMQTRVILDILHVASQRTAVNIVQQQYFSVDQVGNPVGLNPAYGSAYRYQPPMSLRLGMEVSF